MLVTGAIERCRDAVRTLRAAHGRVGFVPTMGALHEGHLSLIRAAQQQCDAVVVSIFVNPTQFGPGEDFQAYPRPLEADLSACSQANVDLVFTPASATMYPDGACTTVHLAGLTNSLCGRHRASHFDGVATVVTKLFGIVPADAAFFGEKDYQQLVVVRQLVHDLNILVEIVGCPIVRENDGLAVSSRNVYLSPAERMQAVSLSMALFQARKQVKAGERRVATLVEAMEHTILQAGSAQIDYIEAVDPKTLARLSIIKQSARLCLAVGIGCCRLIDNIYVDAGEDSR